jgi:hypothetical protein
MPASAVLARNGEPVPRFIADSPRGPREQHRREAARIIGRDGD